MDTRDAVSRSDDDASFTFHLSGDSPRVQASRVALGSLEFPMVQWTIEEAWSRLYFSEGFRLSAEMSGFRLHERCDGEEGREHLVRLPPQLNKIESMRPSDKTLLVTCAAPHGLWAHEGSGCALRVVEWGPVEIVCSGIGRVSLSELYAAGQLHYETETSFRIPHASCDHVDAGYVHVPTYPSPSHLCDAVSHVLAHLPTRARYELVYRATSNRATLQAIDYPPEAARLELRLYGSGLARLLGYAGPVHERVFTRPAATPDRRTAASDFYSAALADAHEPPLALPSDPFAGWHFVELQPGWYAPAHRPMCTGNPLRLAHEVELALNRMNFQPMDKVPPNMPTGHVLVFTDPAGVHHLCQIYHGTYTAESMAAALETEMTRVAGRSLPGTLFTVEYDASEGRFTFSCEVRDSDGGHVRSAPFGLFLPHPGAVDPRRFGFDNAPLMGCDTYTSPNRAHVPSMQSALLRPPCNRYAVSEIGYQKRLRVETTGSPPLLGVIVGYDIHTYNLRLHTYCASLPYAHGWVPGDVVEVTAVPTPRVQLVQYGETGKWEPAELPRCPLAPRWGASGIVVDPAATAGPRMPNAELVTLTVRVRPTPDLANCVGTVVALRVAVQPANLCFAGVQSVPGRVLGFPDGATQWGVDGSVPSGARLRVPPFVAPAVHVLDHPDYVLMFLSEGKTGTTLQHRHGAFSGAPFAKIVLYPLFREERMLPRDTTLLSGESLAHFTIRFTNPDGTPYRFHNVDFSFALNFFRQLPG